MKNSYITITDQFCGAGGSSQGARRLGQRVKGIEVKLALNHWKLAIETHQHNFENTLNKTINKLNQFLKQKSMENQTLKMSKDKARKLYKISPPEWKEILEENFGKKFFFENILDRIKNFNDICLEVDFTEEYFKNKYSSLLDDEYAYKQLKLITEVLNEDRNWVNFDNTNQNKWWPYHSGGASGFAFSGSDFTCTYTLTSLVSRLAYKTEKLATFSGKVFIEIWKKYKI